MKKTYRLSLELSVDIDGSNPGDSVVRDFIVRSLNESMPSVFADSDELDCIIFADSWAYECFVE